MRIQFSQLEKLEISQYNDKAKDYTIQSLDGWQGNQLQSIPSSKLSQPIQSSESNDNLSKDEFVGMFKKAF